MITSAALPSLRSSGRALRRLVLADSPQPVPGRRALQVCLGLIWLLDAGLQFQPYMFGPFFVTQTIEPSAAGDPGFVADTITWAGQFMLRHIVVYNAVFAAIQLLIAVGILWPRTVKAALAASVVWAFSVWWFGEGLGGLLTGSSPLAGVPGGVLLYALIAILLWPKTRAADARRQPVSPAASGPLGWTGANLLWLAVWGSFCYYLLLPANRSAAAISQTFTATDGQPAWLVAVMNTFASLAAQRGVQISVALALLCAFAAVGVFSRRLLRAALAVAVVLSVLIWIAEGLGGIFTGQGTDPNTGPLLVLLAACFVPRSYVRAREPAATGGQDATPTAPDRERVEPTAMDGTQEYATLNAA
jgi:hypothetical protein